MKVLLTGGAGYVASACLRWLLKHGHDPIAFDNLSEGNGAAVPDGRLVVGDMLDVDALRQAMTDHGVEAVMHFAALASVPESIEEPQRYWSVNVVGTKNVLDAMRDVGLTRLLFSSTAATYSFDAPMPLREDSPTVPQVPYGTTKLSAERMIKDYARAYGLGYAILRYFNASGADPDGEFGEDRRHESHLIPLVLHAAVGRRDHVKVFGGDWPTPDGSCVRDYVHTDDLAAAHQLAMEQLEPGNGEVYNVGTGRGASVLEVVAACAQLAGHPIPHPIVDRRPGDPAVLIAASDKLQERGWTPQYTDIKDVVRTAWQWHQKYPGGYRDKTSGVSKKP